MAPSLLLCFSPFTSKCFFPSVCWYFIWVEQNTVYKLGKMYAISEIDKLAERDYKINKVLHNALLTGYHCS
jgi:hypothetical protein